MPGRVGVSKVGLQADVEDEDLAVADSAGAGNFDDPIHDSLGKAVVDEDGDLDLGKVDGVVLAATVEGESILLSAVTLCLGDTNGVDLEVTDGFEDGLGAKRFDDRHDLLHIEGRFTESGAGRSSLCSWVLSEDGPFLDK